MGGGESGFVSTILCLFVFRFFQKKRIAKKKGFCISIFLTRLSVRFMGPTFYRSFLISPVISIGDNVIRIAAHIETARYNHFELIDCYVQRYTGTSWLMFDTAPAKSA